MVLHRPPSSRAIGHLIWGRRRGGVSLIAFRRLLHHGIHSENLRGEARLIKTDESV
jgi:hypothetical protein